MHTYVATRVCTNIHTRIQTQNHEHTHAHRGRCGCIVYVPQEMNGKKNVSLQKSETNRVPLTETAT